MDTRTRRGKPHHDKFHCCIRAKSVLPNRKTWLGKSSKTVQDGRRWTATEVRWPNTKMVGAHPLLALDQQKEASGGNGNSNERRRGPLANKYHRLTISYVPGDDEEADSSKSLEPRDKKRERQQRRRRRQGGYRGRLGTMRRLRGNTHAPAGNPWVNQDQNLAARGAASCFLAQ